MADGKRRAEQGCEHYCCPKCAIQLPPAVIAANYTRYTGTARSRMCILSGHNALDNNLHVAVLNVTQHGRSRVRYSSRQCEIRNKKFQAERERVLGVTPELRHPRNIVPGHRSTVPSR
eukprot:COSAG02_NODE_38358_length_430_cov_0.625378_1_plen_118_part_00